MPTPDCAGINHADFSIDGRYAIFTCEFNGSVTKIDLVNRKVLGTLAPEQVLRPPRRAGGDRQARQEAEEGARPGRRRRDLHHARHAAGHPHLARRQALLRRRHDGRRRARRRRRVVQADRLHRRPASARTASTRAATARSSTSPTAAATRSAASRRGPGSVSVIDFATRQGRCRPGRSPAAAAPTWATSAPTASTSGSRAATTTSSTGSTPPSGAVDKIKVGREPHGLTVWPQPGRYSLGHTGNLR